MAASGSKSVKITDWNTLKFTWNTTSQSKEDNTSTISWKLQLVSGSSGYINSSAKKDWSVKVNGKSYSGTNTVGNSNNTTKTLASGTTVIEHNADGSKTFSYSFSQEFAITFSGSYIGTKSGSGSGELDLIPKPATITAAPNCTDEANPTITYSNPAGSAVDGLDACISLTGAKDDIAYRAISKTDSSYTFNLTTAERNVLRKAAANAKSITVRFYIRTTIGENVYRSNLSKTLTIVNANPDVSATIEDTNATTLALTGDKNKLIKYFNTAKYSLTATAKKEATLKEMGIKCGGKQMGYMLPTFNSVSSTFSNVESGIFTISATDSRGNTTTKTIEKTFINYVKLTSNVSATQPTANGEMTLILHGNYFNGSFGAVNNSLALSYRFKEMGGDWGEWFVVSGAAYAGNTYNAEIDITGLDYQKTYIFQARAVDKLITINSAEETINITPVFDWSVSDFNFNVPVNFSAGFTTVNKLLWEGSYYMTAGQTANLKDAVSNQQSGIVLVFSRYDIANSSPMNEHFSYHFVPKMMVELQGDKGSVFNMATSNQSYSASKYLYIDDTAIRGHDNNGDIGTGATGVNYNNNRFVLRYVIGV